jgi:hypothetical protein
LVSFYYNCLGNSFIKWEFHMKADVEITLEITCTILKTALNLTKGITNINVYEPHNRLKKSYLFPN